MSGADSATLRVLVARSVDELFDFFVDPRNLPRWARASNVQPGDDGFWTFDTPGGPASIRFHADRTRGIVDHEYRHGSTYWRIEGRVAAAGTGAELALTLHRPEGMTAETFAGHVRSVEAELTLLHDLFSRFSD